MGDTTLAEKRRRKGKSGGAMLLLKTAEIETAVARTTSYKLLNIIKSQCFNMDININKC